MTGPPQAELRPQFDMTGNGVITYTEFECAVAGAIMKTKLSEGDLPGNLDASTFAQIEKTL